MNMIDAALLYLKSHAPADDQTLLNNTIGYLIARFHNEPLTSVEIAVHQAWGIYHWDGSRRRIDVDHSTAQSLFWVDAQGRRRFIATIDLERLIGEHSKTLSFTALSAPIH